MVRGLHLRADSPAHQGRDLRHQPAGLRNPADAWGFAMTISTRSGRRAATIVATACVLALLIATGLWWIAMAQRGITVTAYFDKAVGVYPGSEVKVLGVGVGRIDTVTPQGDRVRVEFTVDD